MYSIILLVIILFSGQSSAIDSKLPIKEVAPGIFVHFGQHELPDKKNRGAIANIGFIIGERCVAVIDSGGNPEQGRLLKNTINDVTDKPICYVINTHVHPDHVYGNAAFKTAGVKFIGHKKLERALAARAPYYIEKSREQLNLQLSPEDFIPPDISVNKHLKIDLGSRQLLLTAHQPAHTDNDLSILDENTRTLWLSDLLFLEHIPVIDGSLKGWLNEINELEKNNYNVVVPGHGPVVKDWPAGIQPQKEYLETLLTEIRKLLKQGVYLEDAVSQVGLEFREKWKLFEQFHKKNVTTAFAELEWE